MVPQEQHGYVTPLAGVWIEMLENLTLSSAALVTPLAGVWIEISSRPRKYIVCPVTPLAGVWIEICYNRFGSP